MKATSELRVKGANCSETKSHSCGKIMNYDVTPFRNVKSR